jgi:hypothetical protein
MVFKSNFNNISVLLVEETGVSGENDRPVASHWQTLSLMLYRVHIAMIGVTEGFPLELHFRRILYKNTKYNPAMY